MRLTGQQKTESRGGPPKIAGLGPLERCYRKAALSQAGNGALVKEHTSCLSLEKSMQRQDSMERTHQSEDGRRQLGGLSHSRSLGSESVNGLSYLQREGRVLAFPRHQSLLPLQGIPERLLSLGFEGRTVISCLTHNTLWCAPGFEHTLDPSRHPAGSWGPLGLEVGTRGGLPNTCLSPSWGVSGLCQRGQLASGTV